VNPGPLGAPPADLAARPLDIVNFDKTLFRSHNTHHHPVFYGKTGSFRFDAPDGSHGVLYAGADAYSAFAESLIKTDNLVITTTELKSKALAELRAKRPLRLIDITPSGALVRMGADSRLFSGERTVAQLWSKALPNCGPKHYMNIPCTRTEYCTPAGSIRPGTRFACSTTERRNSLN